MIHQEKIMIADNNEGELKRLLSGANYGIVQLGDIDELMPLVMRESPSLIIGDFKGLGASPENVCRWVKGHHHSRHIPIIVVTEPGKLEEKITAVEAGASDFIVRPYQEVEVLARVKSSISNFRNALNANPLTYLPGNISIQEKLEELIQKQLPYGVSYFDIDHFKSYNDYYGYTAGDKIIQMTSNLLLELSSKYSRNEEIFVGHVGGDDFVMICSEEIIETFCEEYIFRFDQEVKKFYDKDTLRRGCILGRDRQGRMSKFPLVSISIAVVINDHGTKFNHLGQIASAGAEIKKYLKGFDGSSFLVDRRVKY